jgi:hypothetical protein
VVPSVWPLPGLMLGQRLPFPLPRPQVQGMDGPTLASLDWPLRICMARKMLIAWLKSWLSAIVSHGLGIYSASGNSFRLLAGDADCGPGKATAEVANCFFSPTLLQYIREEPHGRCRRGRSQRPGLSAPAIIGKYLVMYPPLLAL